MLRSWKNCSANLNITFRYHPPRLINRNKIVGGGANSKKVNTPPKIPEIDLDFFRLLLTLNKIVQILS